jgi:GDPmannose 4,6-dehydratase
LDKVYLHAGSLESFPSIHNVVHAVEPEECYHLAAQSYVSYSFDDEFSTVRTNVNGTHHILARIKDVTPKCRFYFAGSSEMFGKVAETPQIETTRFHPRSAYGISTVADFDLTRNYREAYGIHAYILVSGLRRLGLKATELAEAQVSTIRTKLLKIGAQIRVTVRKVWVSMASSYPWQNLHQQVWTNLRC